MSVSEKRRIVRIPHRESSSGHTIGSHHGIAVCCPLVEVNAAAQSTAAEHSATAAVRL